MKYDFSRPLTEKQMEVVSWIQSHNNEAAQGAKQFGVSVDDAFAWTIQDYEARRASLMEQGKTDMTTELLRRINSIYENEVNLNKIYEDWKKAQ